MSFPVLVTNARGANIGTLQDDSGCNSWIGTGITGPCNLEALATSFPEPITRICITIPKESADSGRTIELGPVLVVRWSAEGKKDMEELKC